MQCGRWQHKLKVIAHIQRDGHRLWPIRNWWSEVLDIDIAIEQNAHGVSQEIARRRSHRKWWWTLHSRTISPLCCPSFESFSLAGSSVVWMCATGRFAGVLRTQANQEAIARAQFSVLQAPMALVGWHVWALGEGGPRTRGWCNWWCVLCHCVVRVQGLWVLYETGGKKLGSRRRVIEVRRCMKQPVAGDVVLKVVIEVGGGGVFVARRAHWKVE